MDKSLHLVLLLVLPGVVALPPVAFGQERTTGLRFLEDAQYRSIPLATAPITGQLPTSVDLQRDFPQPGDQGEQASCAAWAVAYNLKSFQERRERGWSLTDPTHLFSPAFIYNQLNRSPDCKGGLLYEDVLNLVRKAGAAPLALVPYSDQSCSGGITDYAKQSAKQYAIADWRRVNVQDDTEVKSQVAAGFPVLIGMTVDKAFMQLKGPTKYQQFVGPSLGGHAMVVVGYDDDSKAFKVINSWGTSWGDRGFGWIDYATFGSLVREGYVAQDIVAPPTPLPAPPSPEPQPIPGPSPPPNPPPVVALPSASLGAPQVRTNQLVPGPAPQNMLPGLVINVPGTLEHARGHIFQLIFRFTYPNGLPLRANPNEQIFRDLQGMVTTYLPAAQVFNDPVDLTIHATQIPLYALNFQPSTPQQQIPVAVYAVAMLDGVPIGQSAPTQFAIQY